MLKSQSCKLKKEISVQISVIRLDIKAPGSICNHEQKSQYWASFKIMGILIAN